MSFSFVDRITELEPRRRARGVFRVPDTVEKFPAALLVEAVGQLAAWVAMAAEDFARRPVAALAQRITLGHSLPAGTVIDLAVDVARCDRDAMLYQGTASVGGTEVTRLHRCLGPMLPLADFDAPEVVRQRFEALCAGGIAARVYDSGEWLLAVRDEELADEQGTALLRVPSGTAFLGDHFSRKPVLPATLLFDAQLRMAVRLALVTMVVEPGTFLVARVLRDAKVRAFMTPGTELVLGAQVFAARRTGEIAVNAKCDGKQVASARVEIAAESSLSNPLVSSPRKAGRLRGLRLTKIDRRRVAITGLGVVTPVGNDVPAMWGALLDSRSGIAPITSFDASGFPVRIAAAVKDFDGDTAVPDPRWRKYATRHHAFALQAAAEALRDADTHPTAGDATRWGCVVGAGMMGVEHAALDAFAAHFAPTGTVDAAALGRGAADVVAFARSQVNAGLSLILQSAGIRGYASAVHTACASGGQAIGQALAVIRRGAADAVLAGGFDSMLNPVGLSGFCLLGALSPDNETPTRASRPFHRTRNGFVLGEGAGFLVLEEWQRALSRGARIYAELAGQGNSLSSYRITDSHPSGAGAIQAMRAALADAAIEPTAVDYLNAHGTSTAMNDRSECVAVRQVFAAATDGLSVSSTKSLMGHLIAAAGAVEAVVCALAIRDQRVPPSANLDDPDPECALAFARTAERRPVRAALSNSFGFGGANNCLVFSQVRE